MTHNMHHTAKNIITKFKELQSEVKDKRKQRADADREMKSYLEDILKDIPPSLLFHRKNNNDQRGY